MKKLVIGISIMSVAFGISIITAPAQMNKNQDKTKINRTDTRFVMAAAEGGMAEVDLGKLAEEKASNQAVKDFGKKMVEDHGKMDDQLKTAVEKLDVTLPSKLNTKDSEEKAKLSKLSGTAFDEAYIRDMVKDHRQDVAAYRREASSASNEDVKLFASKTLPKLEEHLRVAVQTNTKIRGSKAS